MNIQKYKILLSSKNNLFNFLKTFYFPIFLFCFTQPASQFGNEILIVFMKLIQFHHCPSIYIENNGINWWYIQFPDAMKMPLYFHVYRVVFVFVVVYATGFGKWKYCRYLCVYIMYTLWPLNIFYGWFVGTTPKAGLSWCLYVTLSCNAERRRLPFNVIYNNNNITTFLSSLSVSAKICNISCLCIYTIQLNKQNFKCIVYVCVMFQCYLDKLLRQSLYFEM